jgi:sodium-dependent dicarboxylate transporter 2/3/5
MLKKLRISNNLIFTITGPLVFLALESLAKPATMNIEAYHVLAITAWIAIWWISEAVPIAVTALLPIVLFPLMGVMEIGDTTAAFGHKYIFLYIGGFMLAIAIEKWGLHKRIALNIINIIGSDLKFIVLGFMLATAFLSMWISNTATSVMMLPIGLAIVSQFKASLGNNTQDSEKMGKVLMLAIAYSASIGGFATLIGTPPNLVLAGILEETYGIKLSFFDWMKFALPMAIILLTVAWLYLTRIANKFEANEFPGGRKQIRSMLLELGKITSQEKVVLVMFVFTALAWISRSLIQKVIPGIDDTVIAMISGILLFVIPSGNENKKILEWDEAVKLPWGIILLFGGGMALANGFKTSGLAFWIAEQMTSMQGLTLILLILVLVLIVNFLTEITSNLATTAMLLPVLAPMAFAFDLHPYMIMVSVTIAASCAFMLPVATPPNAVVFGSGYLRVPDMVKSGFFMNIFSALIVTAVTFYLLPTLWNIDPNVFPENFKAVLNKF